MSPVYFFSASVVDLTLVRARSTVPMARPRTLPTARPTLLAFRLDSEDRVLLVLDVFFFALVVFPAVVDFAGCRFFFLSMTCAVGSISLCETRFLGEGVFFRGCVFFANTFRMLSSLDDLELFRRMPTCTV